MGEARQTRGLSDAPGGPAAGRLPARLPLRLLRDERGATAIEYGLIISLIFLAIVTSLTAFGNAATDKIEYIDDMVGAAIGPGDGG